MNEDNINAASGKAQVGIDELLARCQKHAEEHGNEIVRTEDDEPEELGYFHIIDPSLRCEEVLLENYAEEHGLLSEDEYVHEWR